MMPAQTVDMRGLLRATARIPAATGYMPANSWTNQWGYGFPDAAAITTQLQSKSTWNGQSYVTPLLGMEAQSLNDYFYTTSPTMAMAAYEGSLIWPRAQTGKYCAIYGLSTVAYINPRGYQYQLPSDYPVYQTGAPIYPNGQTPPPTKSCDLWAGRNYTKKLGNVFITPKATNGQELLELRRYSFLVPGTTGPMPEARHIYYAHAPNTPVGTGVNAQLGWKFDGIEGYVYPPDNTAPFYGMTKLWLLVKSPSVYRLVTGTSAPSLTGWLNGYSIVAGTGANSSWGWIFSY